MPGARTRKAERRAGIWTLVLLVRFSAPGNLPSALSYRTCRFCCRRPATLKEPRGRMEVSDELVVCVCARAVLLHRVCVVRLPEAPALHGQQTETTKERVHASTTRSAVRARASVHWVNNPPSSSSSSSSSCGLTFNTTIDSCLLIMSIILIHGTIHLFHP